jgi:hypothetical protein
VSYNFSCSAPGAIRFLHPQALERFDMEPFGYAHYACRGNLVDLFGCNGLLIVEAWKQNLEQVFANLSDRPI